MKKTLLFLGVTALVLGLVPARAQNTNSSTTGGSSSPTNNNKRSPIFRATPEQIKQAQSILKERGFYEGEQTGKLDTATRAGLRSYQKAEAIRETGTLNKLTLEKMGIALTEAQSAM
ncbi:MAG: peptidoglycan-binding domain-containing protein [Pyrinomonadaceae bacterium]